MKNIFLLLFVVLFQGLFAQINQTDAQGKKHGKWVKYKQTKTTKKIRYKGQFDHGVPVDTFQYFYENGRLQFVNVFRGKTGVCYSKQYNEKKQLEAEGIYNNQKKDSTWTYYGLKGQLVSREDYNMGELDGAVIVYYLDGSLAEKTLYKEGKKNGVQIQKYADGKKRFSGVYLNDKLHGEVVYYNQNGRPFYKGEYVSGLRNGTWLKIENGRVVVIEKFRRGKLDGTYIEKYANGNIKLEANYAMGKLSGEANYYNEKGELIESGKYNRGVKEGEWKTYEAGKVVKTETYVDGEVKEK